MLALVDPAVVERPQLGTLVLGVPLPEVVAEGEHPLLGPGLVLVAPGTAEAGVEAVLGDGVEQGDRLQPVAGGQGPAHLGRPALVDGLLDAGHDEPLAQLGHPPVAELERLGEVVAGVDVHHREGELGRPERLLGQAQQDQRVLAAAEEEHRALQLGRHLPHDVDRLRLEGVEVGQLVRMGGRIGFIAQGSHRGRACPHGLHRLLHGLGVGGHHQLGVDGRLVGVVDPGEAGDGPRSTGGRTDP